MNLRELKELFRLVEKTDFTEVEIVQGDLRVRVERGKSAQAMVMTTPTVSPTAVPSPQADSSDRTRAKSGHAPTPETPSVEAELDSGHFVTSPFVGTFYRSPSPDAEAYVEVGQVVKSGQSLCIVEAMKLMNEIEADFDCKIVKVLKGNAEPVEFGEKLFEVEPI